MRTQPPTVSMIIPNWNGVAHLPECLDSVRIQSLQPAETIVVDDDSSDGSVDLVRNHYGWVSIIKSPVHSGVGAVLNRGIRASKGEYVALLNNDVVLTPQWLEIMVTALRSEDAAGSIACKMLKFFDRTRIDAAGDVLTRAGSPYSRGSNEPDDGRYAARQFVFGACGAATLFRRSTLDNIGLFDEDFIAYYEDVDLSFRAQLGGYKCLYVPEAVCYHKRGATYNKVSGFAIRMQERNLTALYVKNFPAGLLLTKSLLILGSRIRRFFRSARAGVGRPAFVGMWEGMTLIPGLIAKRKSVQANRSVSIRYLREFMRREKR